MKTTITAVFEDGVFKPTEPPSLADGEHVRITVETDCDTVAEDVLGLARDVYRGLSSDEIAEVERLALDREHFFSRS